MVERDAGAIDIAAMAGGSSALYASGSAVIEPYVQGTTSLPVTIYGGSNFQETHGVARFGVRHRFAKKFALGAGLGPSFVIINPANSPLPDGSERQKWWAPYFDIEIAGGRTTKKKRFNVSFRPGTTVFTDRIGLATPLGVSWQRRLGRHVTLGFDSWGGLRMVFERPGSDVGLASNPLVVGDFGVGVHIGVHIPRPKGHKMRTFMRF